ncbi:MAG: hypothetical protein HQ594_07015 [Candidatus Omnitrophica bacterium]|nr:hypothetical protein [Candidatus Omnitrophota bacterium]
MRRMDTATGTLVFLGLLLLVNAIIVKTTGVNLLAGVCTQPKGFVTAANSCFLFAIIVDKFNK